MVKKMIKQKKHRGVNISKKDVFGDESELDIPTLESLYSLSTIRDSMYGLIMGYSNNDFIVNENDINTLILAPPGVGKTKTHAITNSMFNSYKNVSQIIMDSKDEIRRKTQADYERRGIKTYVLDLRNPRKSLHWNMLDLVNKYIDLYQEYELDEYKSVEYYARAEEYALRVATAIINQEDGSKNHGDNAFFRDTAKGLLASMILLVSENCEHGKRHIKSVYKMIQSFSGMDSDEEENELMTLFKKLNKKRLNDISKISDFGFASAVADVRTFKNIISSTLTQVQDFLQSDLEQILCHDSEVDIDDFLAKKSVIYIIVPDEKKTRHFLGSLFIQNFVTELITYAENNPLGRLERKVICYWDEFGNMPQIPDFVTLITAARSRNINITNVLQSLSQLKKTYGEEVNNVLKECYQVVLVGCLAPLANETAKILSEATGEFTLSYKTNSKSTNTFSLVHSSTNSSEQLVKRAVMKPEDFKKLKVGEWVVFSINNSVYKHNFKMFDEVFKIVDEDHVIKERTYKSVQVAKKEDIFANIDFQYNIRHSNVTLDMVNDCVLS